MCVVTAPKEEKHRASENSRGITEGRTGGGWKTGDVMGTGLAGSTSL